MKVKKEKESPTPNLGIPNPNRQIFTYSENKLLDQITTEVMQAWRNDLNIIREHHSEILNSQKSAMNFSQLLIDQFPKLETFLNEQHFIDDFKDIRNSIEHIKITNSVINKTLFDLEQKINFSSIQKIMQSIKNIVEDINEIKNSQKRKWWHRFFKPKT